MATLPFISSKKNDFESVYGNLSSSEMKSSVMGVYDSGRGGVGSDFKSNLRFTESLDDNLSIMKEICNVLKESLDFDKESELNRKNSELNKPTTSIPVKTSDLNKKDKKEEKTEKPFEERAAKFLKTGNFFTDLKNLGVRTVKDELLELTDIGFGEDFKFEDYITPLKKFREFLDPRRKSEIEKDKRVKLREEVDELETLSEDDAATKEEKDKFSLLKQQKMEELGENEKLSEIEQQQLVNLDKLVEYQDEQQKLQRDSLKLQQEKSIDDEKLRVKQEELLEKQLEWPENLKAIAELLKDLKKAIEECCLDKCEGEGGGGGGFVGSPTGNTGADGDGKKKNPNKKNPKFRQPMLTPFKKPNKGPWWRRFTPGSIGTSIKEIAGDALETTKNIGKKGFNFIKELPLLSKLGGAASLIFAGLGFSDRKDKGQTNTEAGVGVAAEATGGILGSLATGAALKALGVKAGLAALSLNPASLAALATIAAGGYLGSQLFGAASDNLMGVNENQTPTADEIQKATVNTSRMNPRAKNLGNLTNQEIKNKMKDSNNGSVVVNGNNRAEQINVEGSKSSLTIHNNFGNGGPILKQGLF